MAQHYIPIALCFLVLSAPSVAVGQTQSADSTAPSSSDSSRALSDTAGDSTSSPDSSQSVSDSVGTKDSLVRSQVTAPPVDSILTAACGASGSANTTAPDLLVVTFAPETERVERVAAARSVQGRLLGAVPSEPGAYYLRVPTEGQEFRLRAAADQLIRSDVVRQVGSRTCPSAISPDTSGGKAARKSGGK
jgi:hypothetical protein